MLEFEQQSILFRWAKLPETLAKYPALQLLHSTQNGLLSTPKSINIAKLNGLMVGIPDVCLPIKNDKYGALWIEMKKKGGIISGVQKEVIALLNKYGAYACVCYNFVEAQKTIINYLENK